MFCRGQQSNVQRSIKWKAITFLCEETTQNNDKKPHKKVMAFHTINCTRLFCSLKLLFSNFAVFLSHSVLKISIVNFSTTSQQPSVDTPGSESDTAESEQSSASSPGSLAPPGMSTAAVKRVTADSPLEPKRLEQVHLYT